jgi:lipopolysaccharide/colanic/teichoic acid biosynthesis glycosyltransferase
MRLPSPSSTSQINLRISLFDFMWILVSPVFALCLRDPNYIPLLQPSLPISPILEYVFTTTIVSYCIIILFGVNESLDHVLTSKEVWIIITSTVFAEIISIFLSFYFNRLDDLPRSVPILHTIILAFGMLVYRLAIPSIMKVVDRPKDTQNIKAYNNTFMRQVMIVGLDPFSISALKLVEKHNKRTVRVVAVFSLRGKFDGKRIAGVRIFSDIYKLPSIIDEYKIHGVAIHEVWVSDNSSYLTKEIDAFLFSQLASLGLKIIKLSDALGLGNNDQITENKTNNKSYVVVKNNYLILKRLLDIFVSTILVMLSCPIFIFVVFITYFELGRPIFFWQERAGKFGKPFRLYKIRTLAFPLDQNGQIISDEMRLSKFGATVRRLRLDELPQLLNIIKGEMSGIGPRPLLPRDQPEDLAIRLAIQPGLTGWAQVNGGELLTVEDKNALDCYYVNNLSLKLDVTIVLLSFRVLFKGVKINQEAIEQAKSSMHQNIDIIRV